MKTILVTGANGYVGKHVIQALKNTKNRIIAADFSFAAFDKDIKYLEGNILGDGFDITSAMKGVDVCLHLAWRDGFNHNSSAHMQDLSSHFMFLERLVKLNVPQIAVMGTMHELGYWEGAVTETTPCQPLSLYGIAKDSLRRAFFRMCEGSEVKAQWLRGYYVYGDDEKSQSIFGKIVRAAKQGKKSFPFTTGKSKYDFIHIDELSRQIATCVSQDSITGIINCCSGKPISLAEQVEKFISENNYDIMLEYGVFPDRAYDSPAIWGDDRKILEIMKHAS